jgi:uncharacterized metal-binding protein YceD (DUF177 family)
MSKNQYVNIPDTIKIVINNSENVQIHQTFIFKSKLDERDLNVISVEEIEVQNMEKLAVKYEVLASLLSAIATISPILLPIFQSLIV